MAIAAGVVCAFAGIALLVLGSGGVSMVVGVGLLGLAGIALVSLAFLLVGESEDREYRKHLR